MRRREGEEWMRDDDDSGDVGMLVFYVVGTHMTGPLFWRPCTKVQSWATSHPRATHCILM